MRGLNFQRIRLFQPVVAYKSGRRVSGRVFALQPCKNARRPCGCPLRWRFESSLLDELSARCRTDEADIRWGLSQPVGVLITPGHCRDDLGVGARSHERVPLFVGRSPYAGCLPSIKISEASGSYRSHALFPEYRQGNQSLQIFEFRVPARHKPPSESAFSQRAPPRRHYTTAVLVFPF